MVTIFYKFFGLPLSHVVFNNYVLLTIGVMRVPRLKWPELGERVG